jgi:DNA-binding beta-propeller fold protein YncE
MRHAGKCVMGMVLAGFLVSARAVSAEGPAAGDSLLTLEASIPLGGIQGRIDHMAVDAKRQRVYVAAIENNTLEIVDLAQRTHVGRIEGLHEPQGVAYVPETDRILVTNGEDGGCSFYDPNNLQSVGGVDVGEDADNVRWDLTHLRLVVGYGEGGLALLDARAMNLVTRIPTPGHPEGFQLDPAGRIAYVNVPKTRQVLKVDLESAKVLATWSTGSSGANYPMAIDAPAQRVYVGCRKPPTLIAFDTETGKTVSRLPTAADPDDIWVGRHPKRVYVSCGQGSVEVFQITPDGGLTHLGTVATGEGARTSLLVPERNEFLVAARATASTPARLLVYRIRG